MAAARPARDRGPEPSVEVQRALQPFLAVSALAATLLIATVGALFFVPLWLAQAQGWTGAGVGPSLPWLAVPALFVIYGSSRAGLRMQLRPLGQVASAVQARLALGAPRARGRLRRGWGAALEWQHAGEALRVVAARGQRSRPELYLVRGAREYRFRDARRPLPELDEALRAVGLS